MSSDRLREALELIDEKGDTVMDRCQGQSTIAASPDLRDFFYEVRDIVKSALAPDA